ncbi:MAG TPA: sigma-70 family RNA polymerase sigma factor [Kofleriaceae bacterium]|nr:sigma-70 family RNA polymerase sigma factor [Kofleriaceae bacterium]
MALSKPAVEGTSGPEDDDRALLGAVAAGDRGALARLYDRYAPMLMAVGVRMLGVRGEAEDLVHDVFLEAWQRASTYDPARGSVRTWLLVRLRSRALDRFRSRSRQNASPVEEPDQLEERAVREEDPALAPDRTAVRRALESLSSEQRVVLELGYFHGLSSSEIALHIGVPIGTVKSRVANGLARLRAGLLPGGSEGGAR